MKTPIALVALLLTTQISFAQTTAPKAGSDKLDVQALEQKYWTAKDDDFSVVQNRSFAKKQRFFGTLHYGVSINDPYYSGTYLGASGGYFFNESWGVEANYLMTSFDKSRAFKDILDRGGGPKANELKSKLGFNVIWTPIYAKMSLFDKKIIHFDMGFTLGLQQVSYENPYSTTPQPNYTETSEKGSSLGYTIGIMQQFYFRENMAIRVDFTNSFSSQDQISYTSQTGTKAGTKMINDTALFIGFTVFDWFK